MMGLRKLKLKRFQTGESRAGYFSFGVRVSGKDFVYLKNNPRKKGSIEFWDNDFFGAYRNKTGNHVLLSVEGISLFDSSWNKRRDISLDRCSDEYQVLRRLAKFGKLKDLEDCIYSLIGRHKL